MGQKTHPKGFRLSDRKDWDSVWYKKKADYGRCLVQDEQIRQILKKLLRNAAVMKYYIERAGDKIRVTIHSAKPGIIIGRKGQELDKIKDQIQKLTNSDVILDIQEVKKPEVVPQLIAESVALQLERRISFRRAMKKAVQTAMSLGIKGIRIRVAGRLGGADIARAEQQREGSVPLHTIRAGVEYGFAEAQTLYGLIGVKVWVCTTTDVYAN